MSNKFNGFLAMVAHINESSSRSNEKKARMSECASRELIAVAIDQSKS
jgi:hypothetical protein